MNKAANAKLRSPQCANCGTINNMNAQRLQLTWYNKDKALVQSVDGRYDYEWTEPSDPRYSEVRPLIYDEYVAGQQSPKQAGVKYSERAYLTPQSDNLLVLGEGGVFSRH